MGETIDPAKTGRKIDDLPDLLSKRLLIEKLRKKYKTSFSPGQLERVYDLTKLIPDDAQRFQETEKSIFFAYIYKGNNSRFLMIVRFNKNESGQPVLKMTPAGKNCDKQIEIIQLDESDNTPELSIVPPPDEC